MMPAFKMPVDIGPMEYCLGGLVIIAIIIAAWMIVERPPRDEGEM